MNSINRVVRGGSSASGRIGSVDALWRGRVVEVRGSNEVFVDIAGMGLVGPMPSFVSGALPGDSVVVGAIRGSRDNFAVIASSAPARMVSSSGQVFRLLVTEDGTVTGVPM